MRFVDADKLMATVENDMKECEEIAQRTTDFEHRIYLLNAVHFDLHFLDFIKHQKTVEERKNGRWIEDEQGDIKCSNCDRYLYPLGIRTRHIGDICRKLKTNYCPECGAIMDEVSEDE